jgi:hypothetical protein
LGETVAVWVQGIGWADYNLVGDVESEGGWGPGIAVTGRDGTKLYRTFPLVSDGVTKVGLYPHAKLGTTTDHGPVVSATVPLSARSRNPRATPRLRPRAQRGTHDDA